MRTLHASGLHATTNADVRIQVAAWIEKFAPDYLTHTEAGPHRSALTLHDGYGVIHPRGDDGEPECAIQYRLDGPALLSSKAVRLSSLPIPRRGGKLCFVTYAEFADHHHIAGHMPSGVEDDLREGTDGAQVRVYRDAIAGLKRFVAGLDGPVIMSVDWNVDLTKPWAVEFFARHFPDFAPTSVPASEPGTHGTRLIDFSLVRGYTSTGDVIPNPTSDHRAIREVHKEILPMANRYPAASFELLGRQTEDRMTAHDIICIHTMVGSLTGTDSMFERDGFGGTESHFGTGGAGEKVKQWQDLAFTADANLDGNPRVISIENADKGPGFPEWSGSNVPAFTSKQLDQLVDLVAWLCSKEAHSACPSSWKCHQVGIPAVMIPDSKPGRRGIGYHRQGIDGSLPDMRVPGGELWSSSRGKICPGDKRVAQIRGNLVGSVAARLAPPPPEVPISPRFDDHWEQADDLARGANAHLALLDPESPRGQAVQLIRKHARAARLAAAEFSTEH